MKKCKYCNQPGRFEKSSRKVLCSKHVNAKFKERFVPLMELLN